MMMLMIIVSPINSDVTNDDQTLSLFYDRHSYALAPTRTKQYNTLPVVVSSSQDSLLID